MHSYVCVFFLMLPNEYLTKTPSKYNLYNNKDVSYEVHTNMGGTSYILFYIHELVEGGKNINCVFEVVDEDTVTNFQTITSPNNKIFVGHDKYTFVHSVVNDVDKVDLYFDNVLAYENLTITPIN